jgi:hypothetical protein
VQLDIASGADVAAMGAALQSNLQPDLHAQVRWPIKQGMLGQSGFPSAAPLILDLGGPVTGKLWELRKLVIVGSDDRTVVPSVNAAIYVTRQATILGLPPLPDIEALLTGSAGGPLEVVAWAQPAYATTMTWPAMSVGNLGSKVLYCKVTTAFAWVTAGQPTWSLGLGREAGVIFNTVTGNIDGAAATSLPLGTFFIGAGASAGSVGLNVAGVHGELANPHPFFAPSLGFPSVPTAGAASFFIEGTSAQQAPAVPRFQGFPRLQVLLRHQMRLQVALYVPGVIAGQSFLARATVVEVDDDDRYFVVTGL